MAGASLNFTPFEDEFIAWQDRAALQEFFEDIEVPVATTDDYGVVKKGVPITYTGPAFPGIANNDAFNLILDGVTLGPVPTLASFQELRDNYFLLSVKFNQLLVSLRDAGIIDEV